MAAGLAWVRMPTQVAGWLYAEDGRLFVGDWVRAESADDLSVLWTPYAGYQHLIPRVASLLVTEVLPVAWWATAVNVVSCLVVGGVAGVVFVCSRDVIIDLPSRVVVALITVMAPIAAVEALGNLANLHHFLLYLTPWLLLATPRSSWGTVGLVAVALLSTTTEPQCALFLPLLIWRVIQLRGLPARQVGPTVAIMAAWCIGVAAQVLSTVIAPRAVGAQWPPVASVVEGYVLNAGMTLGTVHQPFLGTVFLRTGWWVGFLGVAAILAVAVLGFVKGGKQERAVIAALLYGSAATWTASFVLGGNPAFFYSEMTTQELGWPLLTRWGTAASMLLAATIPVTVAVMIRRYPHRRWAWTGLLCLMVVVFAADLVAGAANPALGGSWGSEVEQARATCASTPNGTVELSNPPAQDWVVSIPCSLITN